VFVALVFELDLWNRLLDNMFVIGEVVLVLEDGL